MYETLKQLITESIDAHIWEDELVLKSIKHPLSRYQVWKQYFDAREKGLITEEEYQELHHHYDSELFAIKESAGEVLYKALEQTPYFEVWSNNKLYLSTKSIKSKGIQITTFIKRNGELVAWSDRQCPTIKALADAIFDYGIAYDVNKHLAQQKSS